MAKSLETIKKLEEYAYQYIDECINKTKPHVSGSGKVVEVPDRQIPTIDYFLNIWIPMHEGMKIVVRSTWYEWLHSEGVKSDTIKKIDELFKSLATDIVANEGRGIFYAKNRLGMHDKQHIENKQVDKFDFDS